MLAAGKGAHGPGPGRRSAESPSHRLAPFWPAPSRPLAGWQPAGGSGRTPDAGCGSCRALARPRGVAPAPEPRRASGRRQ